MATIFKRGKVWYSRLRFNGEYIRKPLSTNREIAQEMLGDLVKQRNANRHGHAPANMAWSHLRDEVLALSQETLKKSTWMAEVRAFREFEDAFPIRKIDQMRPKILDLVKSKWLAKGRGKYVINRDLRTIRKAMRLAETWGYAGRQDWTTSKYIKTPKGRLHYWTIPQLLEIMGTCHGPWKTVVYLGSRAGLRRGEIRELQWSNVDFERKRIHIAPTDSWTPKDNERRFIPMPKDLVAYLGTIKHQDQYVFSVDGRRPTVGSMTEYFGRLVQKAKQKGSIHTLRHSFGAHAASAGVPLSFIKEWMGHSSIETTEIYSHLMPNTTDNAIHTIPLLP